MTGTGSDDTEVLATALEALTTSDPLPYRIGGGRIAQAFFGTTPFAGGLGALIATEVQRRQQQRLTTFLTAFVENVDKRFSEQSISNNAFVRSEAFGALLEGVLDEAAKSVTEEKLAYLGEFLCSAVSDLQPDISMYDFWLATLKRLSGFHLIVLMSYARLQRGVPSSDRRGTVRIGDVAPMPPLAVRSSAGQMGDATLWASVSADLAANGLLRDWPGTGLHAEYIITDLGLNLATHLGL